MRLNHLHLHVTDLERSRRFYEDHFGFAEHCTHGDILFLRDEAGLDLALAPATEAGEFPSWFHYGFRLESAEAVRELRERLRADSTPMVGEWIDESDFCCFRCQDPDGYLIEVYWE